MSEDASTYLSKSVLTNVCTCVVHLCMQFSAFVYIYIYAYAVEFLDVSCRCIDRGIASQRFPKFRAIPSFFRPRHVECRATKYNCFRQINSCESRVNKVFLALKCSESVTGSDCCLLREALALPRLVNVGRGQSHGVISEREA